MINVGGGQWLSSAGYCTVCSCRLFGDLLGQLGGVVVMASRMAQKGHGLTPGHRNTFRVAAVGYIRCPLLFFDIADCSGLLCVLQRRR